MAVGLFDMHGYIIDAIASNAWTVSSVVPRRFYMFMVDRPQERKSMTRRERPHGVKKVRMRGFRVVLSYDNPQLISPNRLTLLRPSCGPLAASAAARRCEQLEIKY